MGLVLWIDENTFATSLIEKAFKKQELQFYALAGCKDFGFLIADLDPRVVVIDARTALNELEAFQKQYQETNFFQNKPVILVDPVPGLEFIKNVAGTISRPIDPFTIHEKIAALLT